MTNPAVTSTPTNCGIFTGPLDEPCRTAAVTNGRRPGLLVGSRGTGNTRRRGAIRRACFSGYEVTRSWRDFLLFPGLEP